jgi:phage shock protein PspC (stress-responsive transcriptional regulator)
MAFIRFLQVLFMTVLGWVIALVAYGISEL